MSPRLRRVIVFGARAVALLPLSALCYAFLLPYFGRLMAGFANVVLEAVSSPLSVSVGRDAHLIVSQVGGAGAGVQEDYDPNILLLNLAILPPLLVASPGKTVDRLRAVLWSFPSLLALDLVLFLVLLRTRGCLSG